MRGRLPPDVEHAIPVATGAPRWLLDEPPEPSDSGNSEADPYMMLDSGQA